mgnify:FL=1
MCQAWWHGSIVLLGARVLVHDSSVLTVCTMYVTDSCFLSTYEKLTVYPTLTVVFWKPFYAPKQMKLGTYLSGRGSSVFQYLLYENTWDTSIKQQLCWSLQVIMTRMTSLTFFVGKKCQIVMPGWNFKKFAKNLCGHNRSLTILKTIVFSRAAKKAAMIVISRAWCRELWWVMGRRSRSSLAYRCDLYHIYLPAG